MPLPTVFQNARFAHIIITISFTAGWTYPTKTGFSKPKPIDISYAPRNETQFDSKAFENSSLHL
jgi:hypothetical protein